MSRQRMPTCARSSLRRSGRGPRIAQFGVSSPGQSRRLGESSDTCCRWTPGETPGEAMAGVATRLPVCCQEVRHPSRWIHWHRYEWSWLKYNTCPPHRRPLGRCAEPNRRCSGARARWARIAIPRATLPVAWPATRTRWRRTRGHWSASRRWPPTLAAHAPFQSLPLEVQAGQGGPATTPTATVITPQPQQLFPALPLTAGTPASALLLPVLLIDHAHAARIASSARTVARAEGAARRRWGKRRSRHRDRQTDYWIRHKHLEGLKGLVVFFR